MNHTDPTDIASAWLDTDHHAVLDDVERLGLEDAAHYNRELYLADVDADDCIEITVEHFQAAIEALVEVSR